MNSLAELMRKLGCVRLQVNAAANFQRDWPDTSSELHLLCR